MRITISRLSVLQSRERIAPDGAMDSRRANGITKFEDFNSSCCMRMLPVLSHWSQAFSQAESGGRMMVVSRQRSTTKILSLFIVVVVSGLLLLQLCADRAIITVRAIVDTIDGLVQFLDFIFKSFHFCL